MTTGGNASPKPGAQTLGTPRLRFRKGLKAALGLELRHHLPFTGASVVVTMAVTALLLKLGVGSVGDLAYPWAHIVHLFVSSIASAAVSWRNRRSVVLALAVGVSASLLFCTMSDVALPFFGGALLGVHPTFELELLENPALVIGAALLGSVLGFVHLRYLSLYSHSAHVLVSTFASLGYLLTHTSGGWFDWSVAPALAAILFVSVFVPCCMSDVVMPVACTHCDFRDPDHRH